MSQILVPFERLWGIPQGLQLLLQKAMSLSWSCVSPEIGGFNLGCLEATEKPQAALKVLQDHSLVIYALESLFKLWALSDFLL